MIKDFQQGSDVIDVNGADRLADLAIDQVGLDAVIVFGNLMITLEDQDAAALGRADFLF